MLDDMISGTWKAQHKAVIESFLKELNQKSNLYILKGGTSLMECYGLNRFSEDIDLDSTDRNTIDSVISSFTQKYGYTYRIGKDTATVRRFFIDYGGVTESGGSKPLKVEISYRRRNIPENETTKINGIMVYTLDQIAMMKANAYSQRDKIRDLFDVTFLVNHKRESLSAASLSILRYAISQKGIEQYDFVIKDQEDNLIDKDLLAEEFLMMFDYLDLLNPKEELSIYDTLYTQTKDVYNAFPFVVRKHMPSEGGIYIAIENTVAKQGVLIAMTDDNFSYEFYKTRVLSQSFRDSYTNATGFTLVGYGIIHSKDSMVDEQGVPLFNSEDYSKDIDKAVHKSINYISMIKQNRVQPKTISSDVFPPIKPNGDDPR